MLTLAILQFHQNRICAALVFGHDLVKLVFDSLKAYTIITTVLTLNPCPLLSFRWATGVSAQRAGS